MCVIKAHFTNDEKRKRIKYLLASLRRWYYAPVRLENMHLLNVSRESLHTRERRDRFLRSATATPLTLVLHVCNMKNVSHNLILCAVQHRDCTHRWERLQTMIAHDRSAPRCNDRCNPSCPRTASRSCPSSTRTRRLAWRSCSPKSCPSAGHRPRSSWSRAPPMLASLPPAVSSTGTKVVLCFTCLIPLFVNHGQTVGETILKMIWMATNCFNGYALLRERLDNADDVHTRIMAITFNRCVDDINYNETCADYLSYIQDIYIYRNRK